MDGEGGQDVVCKGGAVGGCSKLLLLGTWWSSARTAQLTFYASSAERQGGAGRKGGANDGDDVWGVDSYSYMTGSAIRP